MAVAAKARLEPHDFSGQGMNCTSCHEYVTVKSRGVMKKPVGEICLGCHKLPGHSHPVDLEPAMSIPQDMPLDNNGLLTCATCHDPHMPSVDRITGKKTLYLRRSGPNRMFCMSCHSTIR